jgi:tetratricopeptide (TPR) repeat protein
LSYLWDLVERMGQPQPLTHAQQHQILIQLQPALRSADPEEREGGRHVLKMFSRRDDLYADVDRTRAQLEFADAAAWRAQAARTAQRRKALVDEMTALHYSGQWEAVVAAAQELAGLDPEHPDPGGIVSDAKAKIRHADLSERYGQAWAQAAELFSATEQEQPGDRDAAVLPKAVDQQHDLAGWLDQAEAAAGHDDWDTAVTALENLCAVDPGYRDAGARLEQARSARLVKQRRSLVGEMTALHQAGRWKEVLAAAEKLAQLDPDHPDPVRIVSDAQAKIRDAQLAEQYAQALNHLDQQHWQQAAEVFTAIEQEQPGYRDAAALLKTAQQKLAQSASLTHEQQREIIDRLQRALFSADPQNRRVARQLLDRFSGRQDLHQDISQTVAQWRMELPTIQSVQQPCPPQVPKAARYRGWVTLPRRPFSIPVVVAVATVIAAVVLVGVLIARDSGSISTPTTSETTTPTTSESPVDPSSRAIDNAVAQGALKGFLLSPEQINTAMGATDMRVMNSGVAMSDDSGMTKPKECRAIDGSAQAQVYAGSNFMAERDQTLQDGYHFAHFAKQAVVLFPSAKKADAFLTASAQQWPACHQYTRIQTQWTVGAISNTNGTLSTTATQQNANAPGWGCGRALAARNNVVIDVITCSANPADSAVTIANQIAAKVPI